MAIASSNQWALCASVLILLYGLAAANTLPEIPHFWAVDGGNSSIDVQPECVPVSAVAAGARCCSGEPGKASGCVSDCGEPPELGRLQHHFEADGRCKARGMRLCTRTELASGLCKGTGCNYNGMHVWTSEPCGALATSTSIPSTTITATRACPGYCPDGNSINWKQCKDYYMDACVYDGCIGGQLLNAGEAVEDVMTVEDCHNACQSKVGCKWFKFSYGRLLWPGKPICSIVSDIAWAGSDTQGPNSDFDTTYTHFLSCPMASTVASSTSVITSTTTAFATTAPPTTTGIFSGPKCKTWCSTSSDPWSAKCTWKKCKRCPQCGATQKPKGCKRWCSKNSQDWSTKCTWKKCKACSECTKDRRLQSSAATFASGWAEDLSIGMVLV